MQEKLQKEVSLLRRRIDCAMGRALCEVLIKKATIADVANGKIIHDVDIAVDAGCIVDIGRHLKARALHVREAREESMFPDLSIHTFTLNPRFSRLPGFPIWCFPSERRQP